MLQQAISISLLAALASIPPAASQGIARNASISGNAPSGPPATRVLVATPYPGSPSDSVAAVAIGDALRNKLSNSISSSDWAVISRFDMNKNLTTWGYGRDQIFPPESARQMVSAMQARMFVMTTLAKTSDGRFIASTRVTGSSDDAGHVVKLTQVAGQTPQDFGNKVAEQVAIVFKAYPDAKSCRDLMGSNKPKALEGANKALKTVPGYGFPEYCLGELEQLKDSAGPETERHFRNAMAGDPLSLSAVNQIAVIHYKKHDTTGVVNDYLKMLQIQPTNRDLAGRAVDVFRSFNRPDAAASVVDTQIKLDPSSPDWPELKGNLCAAAALGAKTPAEAKDKFKCAYDSFLRVYELDVSRADTNFYPRMVFVAGSRADSARWVKQWIDKFSSLPDPYKVQLQMYTDAGQIDSATKVAKILMAIDPTDVRPMLAIEIALLNKQQYDEAIALGPSFKNADEDGKNKFAQLLVTFADSAGRRTPQDDSAMIKLGRGIIAYNPTNKQWTEYAHYFVVRGMQNGFQTMSGLARTDKSCETLTRYIAFLDTFEPSLTVITASTTSGIAAYGNQLLVLVKGEREKDIPNLQKAFCKPAGKP
jgi:hypothetical protein